MTSLTDAKKIIENDFRAIGNGGYVVVSAKVLSAADYGVPQRRERVLFIGFKKSALKSQALKAFSDSNIPNHFNPYPSPTHGMAKNNCVIPHVTVKQALAGLKEPDKTSDIDQKSFSGAKWYGKHCQGQVEVDLNGLGPTIRSEHHGNIEFRRLSSANGGKYFNELNDGKIQRRLTVRECARLQTFPDDYKFVKKNSNERKWSENESIRRI